MKKKNINKIVATVQHFQAIDYTKIYKIIPICNIKIGTPLVFDTEKEVIMTDFPTENN